MYKEVASYVQILCSNTENINLINEANQKLTSLITINNIDVFEGIINDDNCDFKTKQYALISLSTIFRNNFMTLEYDKKLSSITKITKLLSRVNDFDGAIKSIISSLAKIIRYSFYNAQNELKMYVQNIIQGCEKKEISPSICFDLLGEIIYAFNDTEAPPKDKFKRIQETFKPIQSIIIKYTLISILSLGNDEKMIQIINNCLEKTLDYEEIDENKNNLKPLYCHDGAEGNEISNDDIDHVINHLGILYNNKRSIEYLKIISTLLSVLQKAPTQDIFEVIDFQRENIDHCSIFSCILLKLIKLHKINIEKYQTFISYVFSLKVYDKTTLGNILESFIYLPISNEEMLCNIVISITELILSQNSILPEDIINKQVCEAVCKLAEVSIKKVVSLISSSQSNIKLILIVKILANIPNDSLQDEFYVKIILSIIQNIKVKEIDHFYAVFNFIKFLIKKIITRSSIISLICQKLDLSSQCDLITLPMEIIVHYFNIKCISPTSLYKLLKKIADSIYYLPDAQNNIVYHIGNLALDKIKMNSTLKCLMSKISLNETSFILVTAIISIHIKFNGPQSEESLFSILFDNYNISKANENFAMENICVLMSLSSKSQYEEYLRKGKQYIADICELFKKATEKYSRMLLQIYVKLTVNKMNIITFDKDNSYLPYIIIDNLVKLITYHTSSDLLGKSPSLYRENTLLFISIISNIIISKRQFNLNNKSNLEKLLFVWNEVNKLIDNFFTVEDLVSYSGELSGVSIILKYFSTITDNKVVEQIELSDKFIYFFIENIDSLNNITVISLHEMLSTLGTEYIENKSRFSVKFFSHKPLINIIYKLLEMLGKGEITSFTKTVNTLLILIIIYDDELMKNNSSTLLKTILNGVDKKITKINSEKFKQNICELFK